MSLSQIIRKKAVCFIPVLSLLQVTVSASEKSFVETNKAASPASERLLSFVQNVEAFGRIMPQEKVYLHFDNTSYYIGETIWFNAYVVRADSLLPHPLSGILRVELVNQEGTVLDSRKLRITDGRCHGEFPLKENYYAGFYEVRAYTQYMLNFGIVGLPHEKEVSAFFFDKDYCDRFFEEHATMFSRVFPVYNAPKKAGNYKELQMQKRPYATERYYADKNRKEDITVSFFPEGGNLVENLTSHVAFEVRGSDGQYLNVKGRIVDRRGKPVCSFVTMHRGKGDFYVTPGEKERLKAEFSYKGTQYSFDLPRPLKQGFVLAIENSPKQVLARVFRNAATEGEPLGLTIMCRGRLVLFDQVAMDSTDYVTVKIDPALLPTGVNQATLFDAEGRIHGERLFFVNHREYENNGIQLVGRRRGYRSFEKITLEFESRGPFSLSICDRNSREKNYTGEDMISNLLLSSDLYGFIEMPEYYFGKDTRKLRHELDLLTLVQGWRRYSWPEMAGVEPFKPEFKVERSLRISGRIHPLQGTRAMRRKRLDSGLGIEVFAQQYNNRLSGSGNADTEGYFSVNLPDFEGEMLVFLRVVDSTYKFTAKKEYFYSPGGYGNDSKEMTKLFDGDDYAYVGATGEDYPGHRPYEFVPILENFVPHFRDYSYYECHSPNAVLVEADENEDDEGFSAIKADDEAWLLSLPEVEISGKRHVRRLDFTKPALVLNVLDEMNRQLDLGMCLGFLHQDVIALNAAVRHGLRGPYFMMMNKLPYSVRTVYSPDYEEREHDISYYMDRYRVKRDPFSNRIINFNQPGYYLHNVVSNQSSDGFIRNLSECALEYMDTMRIYTDKDYRGTYDFSEVKKDYSASFMINLENKRDPTPIYVGRQFKYQGYSQPAEFYSPNYRWADLKQPAPDYRRTLYWNPEVKPDSQGRARVEFYNNSTAHSLIISAEGLTPDGQPVVLKQ